MTCNIMSFLCPTTKNMGGERVRKATITDKLAIDLNNGVKVINHSQLLGLSLIYIYASFA